MKAAPGPSTVVKLLGRDLIVKLPPQFAVKEELVFAYGDHVDHTSRRLRVCGAILGMCTSLGEESGFDYVKAKYDALAYGGAVYGRLRELGATPAQVATAGAVVYRLLSDNVFPREEEVAARARDFPAPATDESTATPSRSLSGSAGETSVGSTD